MSTKSLNLKQLLIDILEALEPHWDLAGWFLTIAQNTNDDNLINYLLLEVQNWVKSIASKRSRDEIKRKLKKIKENDDKINKKDKEEADKMLEDFIKSI